MVAIIPRTGANLHTAKLLFSAATLQILQPYDVIVTGYCTVLFFGPVENWVGNDDQNFNTFQVLVTLKRASLSEPITDTMIVADDHDDGTDASVMGNSPSQSLNF